MSDPEAIAAERLGVQFHDLDQQHQTAVLGMWIFLATEVMFFGAPIACYIVYWYMYPDVWSEFSKHLNIVLGTVNTAILLTSSFFVALAVHLAREGRARSTSRLLYAAGLFGAVFLAIKAYEWYEEYVKGFYPGAWASTNELVERGNLFFRMYFAMTGLHALHVLIGVALLFIIGRAAAKKRYSQHYSTPVEISGLYWHFVDVVWIFIFPLLYLVDRT